MKCLSIYKLGGGLAFVVVAVLLFFVLPAKIDARKNALYATHVTVVRAEAAQLHQSLIVADLHNDLLLWMRAPHKKYERGHSDIPRLQAGNMAIQVFSSVTKAPRGLNYQENTASSDDITLLAIAQRWPVDSWFSLFARAKFQARRLHRAAQRGDVSVIRTRDDLINVMQARKAGASVIAAILATEGAHPLEGKIENLDRLYREGYRMIGLQHFFDNEAGGSLHGVSKAGLTPFGQQLVKELDRKQMIIDVAHSSASVVRDVLALTRRPVVVSHTGIYSLCPTQRNISDVLLARIAAAGGIIGIGFWGDVTCDQSARGIARSLAYAAKTFGVQHVALGSDFDGSVSVPFDAASLSQITQALLDEGMSQADIRLVMGENMHRFFLEYLPRD